MVRSGRRGRAMPVSVRVSLPATRRERQPGSRDRGPQAAAGSGRASAATPRMSAVFASAREHLCRFRALFTVPAKLFEPLADWGPFHGRHGFLCALVVSIGVRDFGLKSLRSKVYSQLVRGTCPCLTARLRDSMNDSSSTYMLSSLCCRGLK